MRIVCDDRSLLQKGMSKLVCVFCRGKECKYENYKLWESSPAHPNAIKGLFSSWISPQILATQRPSTRLMDEFGLVDAFTKLNMRAIINLQQPGEHSLCGDGNCETGFSYNAQHFLDDGILCFNFGWVDMSVPTVEHVLNIVQVCLNNISLITGKNINSYNNEKVMSIQLKDPQSKIAVHCHAGLGRTGLAIACYLVYEKKISPSDAVATVRRSRPLSLQTQSQVKFVTEFQKYLKSLLVIYPITIVDDKILNDEYQMHLRESVNRQKLYYHTEDKKSGNFIIKVSITSLMIII